MTTRSGAAPRRNQPRKTRLVNSASSGLFFPRNTLAGLPYDIKYHFLHEFHFSPSELLALSQINRSWRECATAETLWTSWYQVLPETIKMNFQLCKNVTKRDLVMLGLTTRCMGCKAWSGNVSFSLMLRLCTKCLVDNPLYKVVDDNTRVLYELKPRDIQHLISCLHGVNNEGGKYPGVTAYRYVSERALIEIAIKKHGGTLESMHSRTSPVQLRAKEDFNRRMALYSEERDAALAQNIPFRKRPPRDTRELSWRIRFNNDISPTLGPDAMGSLYWKDEKMHHESGSYCLLCKVELVELYRVKHGVHLPSIPEGERTISQELDLFKMCIDRAPEWNEKDPGLASWMHYSNHFEELAFKICPLACRTAKRDNGLGGGTCELCCRERALRQHLGDGEVDEQLRETRKIWREITGF